MSVERAQKLLVKVLYTLRVTENTFLIFLGIIIGVLGGCGSIAIGFMIHAVEVFFGTIATQSNPYYSVVIPAIGGLIGGPLVYFCAREARGHGVPEVIYAVVKEGGLIRARVALVKALASAICIGTGGSTGKEGPIVQIGATIGSTVGQLFKLPENKMKTLVGCGVAAGIAATFHAPIAGALFAVEIILGDFGIVYLSPIIITAVVATFFSEQFAGNDFASFSVLTNYQLESFWELVPYVVLGHFVAVLSVVFMKVLYMFEDFFDKINLSKSFEPFKPVIGGLLLGVLALWFPQVWGTGHESIVSVLQFAQAPDAEAFFVWSSKAMLLLVLAKICATSLTLGSGGSGGVFAPSLFIGAMFGGAFGFVVEDFVPVEFVGLSGQFPLLCVLVGMGAMISATTHAPITAIFIIFELTRYEYHIILPLMIASITSTLFARRLMKESIYTKKLLRQGVDIEAAQEIDVLQSLYVETLVKKKDSVVAPSTHLGEIVDKLLNGSSCCVVLDEKDFSVVGTITLDTIKRFLLRYNTFKNTLLASDLVNTQFLYVCHNDTLNEAMNVFGRWSVEDLPVLDEKKMFVGMLVKNDVIQAYNKAIAEACIARSIASRMSSLERFESAEVVAGYSLIQLPVPKSFVAHSLRSLKIRTEYQLEVVLIRKKHSKNAPLFPYSDYVFQQEDLLVLFGENRFVENAKHL